MSRTTRFSRWPCLQVEKGLIHLPKRGGCSTLLPHSPGGESTLLRTNVIPLPSFRAAQGIEGTASDRRFRPGLSSMRWWQARSGTPRAESEVLPRTELRLHRARLLGCGQGYVIIAEKGQSSCTNSGCKNPPAACPQCGFGVLVRRKGPYGPFFACSESFSSVQCGYKRDSNRGQRGRRGRGRRRR